MDHQEGYTGLSRADFIKLARESCSKNLGTVSRHQLKEHHRQETKSLGMDSNGFELPLSMKVFLLRFLCAVLIFLSVLIIDMTGTNYKLLNSHVIKKSLASNQGIEAAEEVVAALWNDIVGEDKE